MFYFVSSYASGVDIVNGVPYGVTAASEEGNGFSDIKVGVEFNGLLLSDLSQKQYIIWDF